MEKKERRWAETEVVHVESGVEESDADSSDDDETPPAKRQRGMLKRLAPNIFRDSEPHRMDVALTLSYFAMLILATTVIIVAFVRREIQQSWRLEAQSQKDVPPIKLKIETKCFGGCGAITCEIPMRRRKRGVKDVPATT